MNKTNKFVDPMEALFARPPRKTKFETLRAFFYDGDEGSCLGRTPKQWRKYARNKWTLFVALKY